MKDFSDFRCQYIDKGEIWKQADVFREQYWPGDELPVDIEFIIQGKLRLEFEFRQGLFKAGLSNAWLTFDRTTVIIDQYAFECGHLDDKINFDLAHEVGHFVLHEEAYCYLRDRINCEADFYAFQSTAPDQQIRYFEYQANEFAGRLMVPNSALSAQITAHCIDVKENGLLEKYRQDPEAFLYLISPEVANVFSVTPTNITERVKREGIWPPDCLE